MGTSPSPPILNIQPPSHTPTNQLASINQKSVKKLIKKKKITCHLPLLLLELLAAVTPKGMKIEMELRRTEDHQLEEGHLGISQTWHEWLGESELCGGKQHQTHQG